jgi:carboxyl-terminal processing protease
MTQKKGRLILLLPTLMLMLGGLWGMHYWAEAKDTDPGIYQDLRLFSDVLNIVQDNYVEKAEPKKLIYGHQGML